MKRRAVALGAGALLAAASYACVIDYAPCATISGVVRDERGEPVAFAAVSVSEYSRVSNSGITFTNAIGIYSIDIRGFGPKVLEVDIVEIVCSPPAGSSLRPDTLRLERVVLRVGRKVPRQADCILA